MQVNRETLILPRPQPGFPGPDVANHDGRFRQPFQADRIHIQTAQGWKRGGVATWRMREADRDGNGVREGTRAIDRLDLPGFQAGRTGLQWHRQLWIVQNPFAQSCQPIRGQLQAQNRFAQSCQTVGIIRVVQERSKCFFIEPGPHQVRRVQIEIERERLPGIFGGKLVQIEGAAGKTLPGPLRLGVPTASCNRNACAERMQHPLHLQAHGHPVQSRRQRSRQRGRQHGQRRAGRKLAVEPQFQRFAARALLVVDQLQVAIVRIKRGSGRSGNGWRSGQRTALNAKPEGGGQQGNNPDERQHFSTIPILWFDWEGIYFHRCWEFDASFSRSMRVACILLQNSSRSSD